MGETNSTIMEWNYLLAEKVREAAEHVEIIDFLMILVGEYGAYLIPPTLVLLFLMKGKDRKDSIFVFLVTIMAIEISYIISEFYYHPRPFEMYDTLLSRVPQNTFPSQHASTLFPFAFAFLYRNRRILGSFFLIWALINSFARIYIGFHFPLDIIAGIIIGIISLILLSQIEEHVEKLSDRTESIQDRIYSYL